MGKKYVTIVAIVNLILFSQCNRDKDPPVVWIETPSAFSWIWGEVEIEVSILDESDILEVEFYVDDTILEESKPINDSANHWKACIDWDASNENPLSEHKLQIKAYDAENNVGVSEIVTVFVDEKITPHGGTIYSDCTWKASENPHVVIEDIDLDFGATLTLEPGVIVRFGLKDKSMWPPRFYAGRGKIIAKGKPDSIIRFTSNHTYPSSGDWRGFFFDSDSSVFDYCQIEYADQAIYCSGGVPKISNSSIRFCTDYAIYLGELSFDVFTNNTITQNYTYPIRLSAEQVQSLGPNNDFSNNAKDGIEVSGGEITYTGTWHYQGTPYLITSDVIIGGYSEGEYQEPVVTINPGCTLKFDPGVQLIVGPLYDEYYAYPGGLVANNVLFSSSNPILSPGAWGGIIFDDCTIDSLSSLKDCIIEYGTTNIFCNSSSPSIKGCEIHHASEWGVYLYTPTIDKDTLLKYNNFHDNQKGNVGP